MTYKYTAVIIEPRKHKALEFVLNNMCECLSDEWSIILFHGTNNVEYSYNIINKISINEISINEISINKIKLINLNVVNLDNTEYSKLLTNKNTVYDHITTELFLIFQTDSMIFKKNSHLLNNFLQYDYVGAPWLITNYIPTRLCDFIGNGGFSLRRKNKMLEIIEKIEYNNIPEDLYFSTKYENIHILKPEYNTAKTFSVEEVFSDLTFACHKPWITTHYNSFKVIYPECEILRGLQYVEE